MRRRPLTHARSVARRLGVTPRPFVLGAGYFWYFATVGVFLPFWPVYLQQRGFGATAIGVLLAVFYVFRTVGPPACASIADRYGRRVRLLRVAVVVAAIVAAMFQQVQGLLAMAVLLAVYSLLFNAVVALYDAQVLEELGPQAGRYGRLRLWGSLGFAVASAGAGPLLARIGIGALPALLAALLLATFASYLGLREPVPAASREPVALLAVLRDRRVVAFLLVCFLMLASHGPYYGFLSLYLMHHGYSADFIGAMWALGVVSETLVFVAASWLLARVDARRLVLIALGATVLRWTLLATWPGTTALVVVAQTLHLASFGMFHLWAVTTARGLFPAAAAARAQALHGAVGYGLGGAVGALGSGWLWDRWGPQAPYLAATFVVIFAFLVAAAATGPTFSDESPVRSRSR